MVHVLPPTSQLNSLWNSKTHYRRYSSVTFRSIGFIWFNICQVRMDWTDRYHKYRRRHGDTVHSGWVLFAPTMGWYDFTSPWKEASAGCVWVGGFSRLIWAFHGIYDQFQINWHLDYRQIIGKKSQEKAHCREVPAVYSPRVGAARTVYCVRNSTASSRIMRALYPEWALLSLYELWIYLLTLRQTSCEAHRDSIKRDKLFTVAHKLHDCFLPVCGQANWYYRSGLTSAKYLKIVLILKFSYSVKINRHNDSTWKSIFVFLVPALSSLFALSRFFVSYSLPCNTSAVSIPMFYPGSVLKRASSLPVWPDIAHQVRSELMWIRIINWFSLYILCRYRE